MIVVFPNPASDELTIETSLLDESIDLQYDVSADEIVLYDKSMSKLIAKLPTESTVKLNTESLPEGEYFLRVKFGKEEVTKHIYINRK